MRDSPYAVYILTSRQRRVLYTGVMNDLRHRVAEHRSAKGGAFSRRYALDTLVWYEWHADITAAIAREKQIKAGSCARKIRLIETMNPEWRDLSGEL
ncbi:MAG TPA: GIY-YIG nuclease family protein [Gemmatimonadales bacterium]|jgi:putative endonuclease|nr:GIY-YIG nuclease family protein [Gemmatimonadales bacterium]